MSSTSKRGSIVSDASQSVQCSCLPLFGVAALIDPKQHTGSCEVS
jgi:hypothetical protein